MAEKAIENIKKSIISGRRKTAVARVLLKPGSGEIKVNQRDFKSYFKTQVLQYKILQPFTTTQVDYSGFDIHINVTGGGMTGQADAVRLAISKVLSKQNEEYRQILRKEGLLTRDPRMVERKKYGRRKARRRFQFSKR